MVRAKRLCRVGTSGDFDDPIESEMMIDEEQSILETQTSSAVDELKSAVAYQYVNPGFLYKTAWNLLNINEYGDKYWFSHLVSSQWVVNGN